MEAEDQGFIVPSREARIKFSDGSGFDGAIVMCAFDVSFDTLFKYQRMQGRKDPDAVRTVLTDFGDEILISWNLRDKKSKEAVPATGEGLLSQPVAFGTALIEAWTDAMVQPPAPLGSASNDGNTSAAQPTRKARRSASRSKSRKQSS